MSKFKKIAGAAAIIISFGFYAFSIFIGNTVYVQADNFIENVKNFGAVGDGNADDTAAIQAAIDSAAAKNATVYIPSGTYMVKNQGQDAALFIPSDVRITGDGSLSIIKLAPVGRVWPVMRARGANFASLGGAHSSEPAPGAIDENIMIDHIAIDGNQTAIDDSKQPTMCASAHGIYFSRVRNVTISNVMVKNADCDAIVLEYSSDSLIAYTTTQGTWQKVGFYLSGDENIIMVGNQSIGDNEGIALAATWNSTIIDNSVSGWGIRPGSIRYGITLTGDSRNNIISANTLTGGLSSYAAIAVYARPVGITPLLRGLSGYYGLTTAPYGGSSNRIINNTIINNKGHGIYLTYQSATGNFDYPIADNNVISGNTVGNNAGYGVLLEGVKNNTIQFNSIYGNLTKTEDIQGVHTNLTPLRPSADNIISSNPGSPPADSAPIGSLDSVDCASLGGWAYDPDNPSASITANIYTDGDSATGRLIASGRTGINGFKVSTPAYLHDGRMHKIYMEGIDLNTGQLVNLNNSPANLICLNATSTPASTPIPTLTLTPTLVPAQTSMPISMSIPIPTVTPILSYTPTLTFTPVPTYSPFPTAIPSISPTPSLVFQKNMRFGSRGDEVRLLQTFLAGDSEIYPQKLITGFFGRLTENAVKRFQKKYGIVNYGTPNTTGYGVVGPKTRVKLNELYKRFD